MLKISKANSKIKKLYSKYRLRKWLKGGKKVFSLDLPAGHSCLFAKDCLSKAVLRGNKPRIQDGQHCKFRCYAASIEVLCPNVYYIHQHNYNAIRSCRTVSQLVDLILNSIPPKCGILRYHASGDFFSSIYFRAALEVAHRRPDILFYGYTKNIPALLKYQGLFPPNLRLVASYGGTYDHLIPRYGGSSIFVVRSLQEAKEKGLPIDSDDSHAALSNGKPFAIMIHGIQPAKGVKK